MLIYDGLNAGRDGRRLLISAAIVAIVGTELRLRPAA